jgi:hypothetical protein
LQADLVSPLPAEIRKEVEAALQRAWRPPDWLRGAGVIEPRLPRGFKRRPGRGPQR